MRRFAFRLQRVLGLRAHAERLARRALLEATAEVRRRQARIATLDQSLAALAWDCEPHGAVGTLALALDRGLRADRRRVVQALELAEERVQHLTGVYRSRRAEAQGLVRLRERRRIAWLEQALRVEAQENDELTRLRAVRQVEELA
jgi:flagellar export protein FliJ